MTDQIFLWLISIFTPAGLLLALLLFFPEKIEKWAALLWKAIDWLGILGRKARKKYIKHDLQGRMNDFVGALRKNAPELPQEKLSIEWVDPAMKRESFIAKGGVVLRLHASDPEDRNFVHGAYLYISTVLLFKAKRYLSPTQREAIDLFVCSSLLRKEKPGTVGFFLEEYLQPKAKKGKGKLNNYLDDFAQIDANNLFVPVLLKELHYLGDKVFGHRKDDKIISEVNGLIDFLKLISSRTVGDDTRNPDFNGDYCKFGIMIVGRREKLTSSITPYINFIKNTFVAKKTETIYLLSRIENRHYLQEIIEPFMKDYTLIMETRLMQTLRYEDGGQKAVHCYLMVLRKNDIRLITPSRF